jgi:amylosucrase
MAKSPSLADDLSCLRLAWSARDFWPLLNALQGKRSIYPELRSQLLTTLRRVCEVRPADLKRLDLARDLELNWFERPDREGHVFYIDRFTGNLRGVPEKIEYPQDLGII